MIDLKYFQNRIKGELRSLGQSLENANVGAGTVMLDQSSVGRLSRTDAIQQQAVAQGMRERLLLRKRALTAALARIDAATYGQCCQCDGDIEPERLNGDTAVVFCFECMVERAAK